MLRNLTLLCASLALAGCAAMGGHPSGTATIKRDTYGVPHVYANDTYGLFYGYGHVVAEDRLFQMEMARRAVLGTVSEVMGPSYVALDKGSRSTFTPESIRAQMARLSADDRAIFDGYAAGFNARVKEVLASPSTLMPRQFIDAGFEPKADWTGYDVAMIWVGTMANRYSNTSSEVANLRLLEQLKKARGDETGRALFDQIRWVEDPLAPTTVPRTGARAQAAAEPATPDNELLARLAPVSPALLVSRNEVDAARRGVAEPWERPVASNLWIAGPKKTADGSTVLINGPQFNWFNPSYVFAVGLHGAGYEVTGNTPFAHPVVLFGTNGKIAWGATAGPLDVNDMYQERLNPSNRYEYSFNGSMRPMTKRTEVIKVKGQPDQTLDVYATVHGIVTDFDLPNNTAYSMKRSWDGYELESLLGWIHSMQAKNWEQWLAQASRVAITINWYYADADGNIGYVSPGRLPIRPASQDPRLPAVGDGSMEWLGIRPFSEDPQVLNPAQGYVANWNNQSAPGAVSDGGNYSVVDRVNEFIARLESKPRLTGDELWAINRSTAYADTNARYLLPFIVRATRGLPDSDPAQRGAKILAAWNMENDDPSAQGTYQSPATTVMMTWLPIIYKQLLSDDLPPEVFAAYAGGGYAGATQVASIRPGNGTKLLYNALLGPKAGVPQRYDFFNGADQDAMIRSTLAQAVNELTARYGSDPARWRTPVTKHVFLTNNFIGAPQAGAGEQLGLPSFMNRGTQNDKVVFSAGGVSMCTSAPPGQSGFIAPDGRKSAHYDDQMTLFKDFGCKSEWLTPAEVDTHLESTRQLTY
ncbi:penicillin acylase family protein [Variovorax ureilyticus]|uniref:Penicillin acylase family protein n=1 Tax=Variovorax ureilyticus TaxID=1836198 RepID=A0ABU8VMZ5_9BURK